MPRSSLLKCVRRDLVGPQGEPEEVIRSYPGDQYLMGILYPQQLEENTEDSEELGIADDSEGYRCVSQSP